MSPKMLNGFLVEKGVNTLIWAVSALRILSDFKTFESAPELPALRKVMFSGEIMPAKTLTYWKKHIPDAMYVNLYGPTEITCNCTYYIVDREISDDESVPIGYPCRNTDILILNDEK